MVLLPIYLRWGWNHRRGQQQIEKIYQSRRKVRLEVIADLAHLVCRQPMIVLHFLNGQLRRIIASNTGEFQMEMLVIAATIGVFAGMGFIFYRAFRSEPNQDNGQ